MKPLLSLLAAATTALALTACGSTGGTGSSSIGSGNAAPMNTTRPPTGADKAAALRAHASVRAAAGLGKLDWSDDIASVAYAYARKLAARHNCKLVHSTRSERNGWGENLWGGWASGGAKWTIEDAVAFWASEKPNYNHNTNTCAAGKECGHYTQLVWRNTREVGCGYATCDGGRAVVLVCQYNPPGNVVGQKPY